MENKKILRNIGNSDSAVVGIVVTVLIIGLVIVIMVMLNTIYVPQWLESSEAAHMEEVTNQFTQLKYVLDIQSAVDDGTAFTTSVTLGNKEIPFFNKGRTYDTLDIVNDAITIDFSPGGSYSSDAIIFSSGNSQFVDQSHIYEAGALIISQDEKSMVYGTPAIIITDFIQSDAIIPPKTTGANITFYLLEIDGHIGKTNAGGYGTYPIYTKTVGTSSDTLVENVKSITITTDYPGAWKTIIEQAIEPIWFDDPVYKIDEYPNQITVTFFTSEFNFLIRSKTIDTQIAFGLAE